VTDTPDPRLVWKERWGSRDGEEFGWQLDEPPPQLVEVLERGGLPQGAALDIACGNGVATRYLSTSFVSAVGFDIAAGAAAQARAVTVAGQHRAFFLVADATAAWPFRDGAFVFAFDRGGLPNLPRQAWPGYFEEAGRVIAPGGTLQILVSRPAKQAAPSVLRRLLRKVRSRALARRPAPPSRLDAKLKELADPTFELVSVERFSFVTRQGNPRQFTQVLFRRREAGGDGPPTPASADRVERRAGEGTDRTDG
jgi:SAM-dependent methyltransferase